MSVRSSIFGMSKSFNSGFKPHFSQKICLNSSSKEAREKDNLSTFIDLKNCTHLLEASDPEVFKLMEECMLIKENFLSEQEEQSLFAEIEPYMKKLRYEFDHWDNVW